MVVLSKPVAVQVKVGEFAVGELEPPLMLNAVQPRKLRFPLAS